MEGGIDNFPEEGMRQLGLGDIHPPERGQDVDSDAPTDGMNFIFIVLGEPNNEFEQMDAPVQKVGDIDDITHDSIV